MRQRIQGLFAGGAFALYLAMGAAAFAQPMAGMPGMAGDGRGDMAHGKMMTAHAPSPAERAGRLRDLLQLRPAQEPALQSFVAALDAAHKGVSGGGMDKSAPMPRTTPERLARMQQMMAQHQTAATAMMDAVRKFYDQLDAGQKRAFDALPMMMHGGMGMRVHMGSMRGPMGEPPPPPPTGR
ncbi:Spy/CpxP family protein refolding chaperone [Phenylobacterium sp. LjRoot225]|uniref:Spy/CpxP family protein refolding chaperone n=1 Tax=Phenylobacterium sp. LjRoot225 TaxID=3342285 RepID=UPI003ECEB62B